MTTRCEQDKENNLRQIIRQSEVNAGEWERECDVVVDNNSIELLDNTINKIVATIKGVQVQMGIVHFHPVRTCLQKMMFDPSMHSIACEERERENIRLSHCRPTRSCPLSRSCPRSDKKRFKQILKSLVVTIPSRIVSVVNVASPAIIPLGSL